MPDIKINYLRLLLSSLNESDKELVYYDTVTGSYYEALVHLNDFLAVLPALEEGQVKPSYEPVNRIVSDEIGKIITLLDV